MGRIPGRAEDKCIRLFQKVLGGARVKRRYAGFEFLRGDPTPKRPKGTRLPVDAYFPDFDLVVEYLGRQHFEENELMDRRPGRREQRRNYRERRAQIPLKAPTKVVWVRYDEPLTEETVRAKLQEAGVEVPSAPAGG